MVIAAEEVDVVSTFWVLMLWRGMVLAVNGEIYGFNHWMHREMRVRKQTLLYFMGFLNREGELGRESGITGRIF